MALGARAETQHLLVTSFGVPQSGTTVRSHAERGNGQLAPSN